MRGKAEETSAAMGFALGRRQVFGPACVFGQVIKTRRNNRIVKVERRAVIGAGWRLERDCRSRRTPRR